MADKNRKAMLEREIEEARAKLRDNTRAIDASTRQILLDTIRANKNELKQIDSEERAPSRKIVTIMDAPTGKSVVLKANSNSKRIIGTNGIRMGLR